MCEITQFSENLDLCQISNPAKVTEVTDLAQILQRKHEIIFYKEVTRIGFLEKCFQILI